MLKIPIVFDRVYANDYRNNCLTKKAYALAINETKNIKKLLSWYLLYYSINCNNFS